MSGPRSTLTSEEFRRSPNYAFNLAESVGAVDIVDSTGRVRATLCGAVRGDAELEAARERACQAVMALHLAGDAVKRASCGRKSSAEGYEKATALFAEAEQEASDVGGELLRLRGGL